MILLTNLSRKTINFLLTMFKILDHHQMDGYTVAHVIGCWLLSTRFDPIYDLWWTEWHWGRFLSPLSYHCNNCFILSSVPWHWYNWLACSLCTNGVTSSRLIMWMLMLKLRTFRQTNTYCSSNCKLHNKMCLIKA